MNKNHSLNVGTAANGVTIVPVAQPAPSLTEGIDAELLPRKEKQRYEEYLANGGSTAVTATIELAGPAEEIIVNSKATLEETGESEPAFTFPVMIHLSNKFLGKDCYNGSTDDPIVVSFISGETNPEPPNVPIHGHAGTVGPTAKEPSPKSSGRNWSTTRMRRPVCRAVASITALTRRWMRVLNCHHRRVTTRAC